MTKQQHVRRLHQITAMACENLKLLIDGIHWLLNESETIDGGAEDGVQIVLVGLLITVFGLSRTAFLNFCDRLRLRFAPVVRFVTIFAVSLSESVETTFHTTAALRVFWFLSQGDHVPGVATRQLIDDQRHPLALHAKPGERPLGMWARHQWKVYLDTDEAIENAIAYVNDNPVKEGKPPQKWNWITPYCGLDPGWTTYV